MGIDVVVAVTFVHFSEPGGTRPRRSWPLADADVGELRDGGLQRARAGVYLGHTVYNLRRGAFMACVAMLWKVPHFVQDAPDTGRRLRSRLGAHCPLLFH